MDTSNKRFLIVAGVHKAGTTSFYAYLKAQEAINAPLRKELHFFTPLVYDCNSRINLSDYLKNFDDKTGSLYLDVSPSYLYGSSVVINKILELQSDVHIVVLLRNPTERFISFYKQGLKTGNIHESTSLREYFNVCKKEFDNYLRFGTVQDSFTNRGLREGCYSHYLPDWMKAFGDKIHVILFDDFVAEPELILSTLGKKLFVKLDFSKETFDVKNKFIQPKSPKVNAFALSVFRRFEPFFRKHERFTSHLKGFYESLNTRPPKDVHIKDMKSEIIAFYKPHNEALASLFPNYVEKINSWNY